MEQEARSGNLDYAMDKMKEMTMEELLKYFAERIDEEIRKKGMNHKEFAESIGKNSAWISSKLLGRRKITLQDLHKIAIGLGFKGVEDFFPERYKKGLWDMFMENIFESVIRSEIENRMQKHLKRFHDDKK